MLLNFNRVIPEHELRGRIFGPDTAYGFVYVKTVYALEDKTVVDCIPLPPGETRIVRDEFGQPRVAF